MKHLKWILALAVVLTLGCASCKKGCNNSKAYNFSAAAKEDDGSCLFCDSMVQPFISSSQYLEDYNSTSPFYYQPVLSITTIGSQVTYSGNGCKLLGKANNNSGVSCIQISYKAILRNITSRTVVYRDRLQYTIGSNTVGTKDVNITIPAYNSDTIPIFSGCEASLSLYLQSTSPTFQYQ